MVAQLRPRFRIRDVAELAGVSPATVSRVLNGSATVAEAKREQVQAVINELGYRPNRTASNLRRQQAQMIGVVISDIENPHFTQMVRAVEDATYRKGYRVLLCNTDEDPAKQRDYLGVLAAERVAGAIISPTDAGAPEISELIDHGTSVVAFDRAVVDRRADAVLAANADGAADGHGAPARLWPHHGGFRERPDTGRNRGRTPEGLRASDVGRPAAPSGRLRRLPLRRWRCCHQPSCSKPGRLPSW